jgi:hypothetical protein
MPNKARERWRRKQKAKKREDGLDRQMLGGAIDLTPHNAVALIEARRKGGKAWTGYVIKFK